MMQTHIEYDDFGEYTETVDLVPVAAPKKECRLPGDLVMTMVLYTL